MEKKVSFYRYFGDEGEVVKLSEVLEAIKIGAYKSPIEELRKLPKDEYDKQKRRLCHFTPSGTFVGNRNNNSLVEYSQVIVLDIDHIDEKAPNVRNQVAKIEYTLAAFISPSGKGVKIMVNTDANANKHQYAYNQIVEYYKKELGVEIDIKGKDVSRACFVSYDPELYYAPDAKKFTVTMTKKADFSIPVVNNELFEKIVAFTEKKEIYIEGNRNNFIHLLACNCNRYGMNEHTTLESILLKYNGLSESEIISSVHSAFNNIIEHGQYDYVSMSTQTPVKFSEPSTTMVCSVFDLIDRNDREPKHEFIWNGIKEASFGYVYGPPKSGKTVFCENLGMSIAAGEQSFLDFSIDQSRKRNVLFIGMEEFWRNRATRNKKQLTALRIVEPSEFKYFVVNEDFPGRLSTEQDWAKIDKSIITYEPDIVFIDSMTRTIQGEIEDSSTSRDASYRLRELVRKYGITLIMIHHTTKLNGDPLNLDKLAGSRVIAQEADFLYGINKSEGTRYIKEVATRYKAEEETVTTFTINENLWLEKVNTTSENYFISPSDGRENPANEQLILDAIRDNLQEKNQQVHPKIILDEIGGTVKQTQFYMYLKKLEAKGKIKRGRGTISLIL